MRTLNSHTAEEKTKVLKVIELITFVSIFFFQKQIARWPLG